MMCLFMTAMHSSEPIEFNVAHLDTSVDLKSKLPAPITDRYW